MRIFRCSTGMAVLFGGITLELSFRMRRWALDMTEQQPLQADWIAWIPVMVLTVMIASFTLFELRSKPPTRKRIWIEAAMAGAFPAMAWILLCLMLYNFDLYMRSELMSKSPYSAPLIGVISGSIYLCAALFWGLINGGFFPAHQRTTWWTLALLIWNGLAGISLTFLLLQVLGCIFA